MKINVSASSPYFAVVIPLHNEEPNLRPLVQELTPVMEKLDKPYEIILVDDGSTDGSYDAMKILSKEYPDLVLVRFRQCYGQTAALDAGFRQALGQVIITLDGDLQCDPQDILGMMPSLDGADLVCGYRAKREDNWIRRLSSGIANGVRNWMTEESVRDVGCSLRIYRRPVVERLRLYNGLHRFLPTLVKMEGFRVVEVPVQHRPRLYGKSKYNIRNRLFRSLWDLMAVRWMKSRQLRHQIEEVYRCDGTSG